MGGGDVILDQGNFIGERIWVREPFCFPVADWLATLTADLTRLLSCCHSARRLEKPNAVFQPPSHTEMAMRHSFGRWNKQEFAEKGFWESSEPFWKPLSVAKQKSRRSQCSCWLHWAAAPGLGLFTSGFGRGTNMYLFEQLCGVFLPASKHHVLMQRAYCAQGSPGERGSLSV